MRGLLASPKRAELSVSRETSDFRPRRPARSKVDTDTIASPSCTRTSCRPTIRMAGDGVPSGLRRPAGSIQVRIIVKRYSVRRQSETKPWRRLRENGQRLEQPDEYASEKYASERLTDLSMTVFLVVVLVSDCLAQAVVTASTPQNLIFLWPGACKSRRSEFPGDRIDCWRAVEVYLERAGASARQVRACSHTE